MKTVTKDPQLEEELQELYLESKHWLSDLHFEEDEIRFLKKMITNYLVPGLNNEQLNRIESFNKPLSRYEANIPLLKNKINELLRLIGNLINEKEKRIGIDLLEEFTALELEMKALFEAVKDVKKLLFLFADDVMKAECEVFISQL